MKLTEKDWTRTGKHLCSFIVHQSGDDLTLGYVRRRAVSNPVSSSNNEFTRYLWKYEQYKHSLANRFSGKSLQELAWAWTLFCW